MSMSKPVMAIDPNTRTVAHKYASMGEAAAAVGSTIPTLRAAIKFRRTVAGFRWMDDRKTKREGDPVMLPAVRRASQAEAARLLRERPEKSYKDLATMTGWTFEELRDLFDRRRLYRVEG